MVHCIKGLVKAIDHSIINWDSFDRSAYEKYERVEHGDLNWIVKNRILAFSGPYEKSEVIDGIRTLEPEDYVKIFKQLNVGSVIRLNRPTYKPNRFTDYGINHYELYFPDGGLPECMLSSVFLKSS